MQVYICRKIFATTLCTRGTPEIVERSSSDLRLLESKCSPGKRVRIEKNNAFLLKKSVFKLQIAILESFVHGSLNNRIFRTLDAIDGFPTTEYYPPSTRCRQPLREKSIHKKCSPTHKNFLRRPVIILNYHWLSLSEIRWLYRWSAKRVFSTSVHFNSFQNLII